VDSWHTGWMLPRPSLVGIQKGSTLAFVVKNPGDWDGSRAGDVEMDGIGDRRAEGYGRILFNPTFLLSDRVVAHKAATVRPQGATGGGVRLDSSDRDAGFLRIVEGEAWKEKIRRTARSYAYGVGGNEFRRSRLSNSQLGALRSAAGSIIDGGEGPVSEDAALALRWLGYQVTRGQVQFPQGVDPWPKTRVEKWGPLRHTIGNLLVEADVIWKLLECYPKSALDGNNPGRETELLRRTTWGFAVRALLDAVCEHAFDVSDVSTGEPKGGRGA